MEPMTPEETSEVAVMLYAKLMATDAVIEAVISSLADPDEAIAQARQNLSVVRSVSEVRLIGTGVPEISEQIDSACDAWLTRLWKIAPTPGARGT